jgi:hypothetical protein
MWRQTNGPELNWANDSQNAFVPIEACGPDAAKDHDIEKGAYLSLSHSQMSFRVFLFQGSTQACITTRIRMLGNAHSRENTTNASKVFLIIYWFPQIIMEVPLLFLSEAPLVCIYRIGDTKFQSVFKGTHKPPVLYLTDLEDRKDNLMLWWEQKPPIFIGS